MSLPLTPPQPPRLPDPVRSVDASYVASLLSVLRLFFNQLQRVVALLTGPNGGQYIQSPISAFYSTATQLLTADTATTIAFDSDVIVENGVSISTGTLTPAASGLYRVDVFLQVGNAGAAAAMSVWAEVNSVAVVGSCVDIPVSADGASGAVSWVLPLVGSDALVVKMSSASGDLSLSPQAARTVPARPSAPSAKVAIALVSAELTV